MASNQTRRKWIIMIGVIVCVMGVVALFGFGTRIMWVGGYDLTVHFEQNNPSPTSIECTTVHRIEEAEGFHASLNDPLERAFFEKDYRSAFVKEFHGKPVTLFIQTTGRENGFGRETAWRQKNFLVVVARWPDGRETRTVADIPDGRKSREMTVRLQ